MKYATLRQAIAEAEQQHGLYELDFMMRDLLHAITKANIRNESVRVCQLKRNRAHGSFPTIRAKLKKLVDEGWVERRGNQQDRRLVVLEATPKTLATFALISNMIESVIRNSDVDLTSPQRADLIEH